MSFYDRLEAGRRLAAELVKYKGEDVVVLALPRGGVPVAAPIAVALDAPLDLVLVRKIGVPFQPEFAMGAVADCGATIRMRMRRCWRDGGRSYGASGERGSLGAGCERTERPPCRTLMI